ncbi:single-stranded-DNA-specific exonuclease RecJ [Lacicoccus alkaliphilus]|uniref:Single-stranded-DNA-specific exonuclease RecJ n=1 Tax=Lacicoccus alkaliphilus DSM 16010 TaxID=1123231 RepID=A0A1M7BSH0_9BACL|nr:single-stranded-DNA-specific exonuclease RecJ [Salinicoccus alkaliphilus]SHL57894.1 single-stranded-DNA-specific exonuclease [Salinicoccus alkaliphilus DSM 16010]
MFKSKYEWKVRKTGDALAESLIKKYGLNNLEQHILEKRGYTTEAQLKSLYDVQLYDENGIFEIGEAVRRIEAAVNDGENILIYGDFDADGITSTAILYSALKKAGAAVTYIIPNRMDHGYGPNIDLFKERVTGRHDLVITVDNGVAAVEEIDYLKGENIDVIVVDHHEFAETMPEAVVVHAGHPEGNYPFRHLAGVGVTYKLIAALGLAEDDMLPLVAIGTVADMVSITGENKKLVIEGLRRLNSDPSTGVKTLLSVSGHTGVVDEETIGFGIAPRLNSSGRIADAEIAVELLLTEDRTRAFELASELESLNDERKEIVKETFTDANRMYKEDEDIIIVYSEHYHPGVIGIVASKLTEAYGKPAIVFTLDGKVYRGSARSVEGLNLLGTVREKDAYINKIGGHSQAFGIEVDMEHIREFRQSVEQHFKEKDLSLKPVKYIDMMMEKDEFKLAEFERFEKLKPFGQGFARPTFMINQGRIRSLRQVGKDKNHIKISFQDISIDTIGFNFGHLFHEVAVGDKISLVGTVNINEFNQKRSLQMIIQDAEISNVQIIDMRSRVSQNFDMISSEDHFLISSDKEKKGGNYFHYGEQLPFAIDTLVLRDLPESLESLAVSIKNIHVSKIIMIFNTRDEFYFTGAPDFTLVNGIYQLIREKEDRSVNLIRDAGAWAGHFNISMKILKMVTDILEELQKIKVENGIINKKDTNTDITVSDVENSKVRSEIDHRIQSEAKLKMSSTQELKNYIKLLIADDGGNDES